eukprot:3254889-Ditylum_brightwellii.AAC.1
MQRLFNVMSNLANTPAMIQKAMAGRPLDPAPFMHLYNSASDLVRDIKVCSPLGILGQIFTEPSSLYIALVAAPDIPPTKRLKAEPTETKESENKRKKKQAQKEGWLKKLRRSNSRTPPGLQTNVCNQHIVVGYACCFMMAREACNYPHSSWACLSAHDKSPVTTGATPLGAATMPTRTLSCDPLGEPMGLW